MTTQNCNQDRKPQQRAPQPPVLIPEALERIAREHLGVRTLHRRGADHLDFHDLAVWEIRAALRAAYEAGAKERAP